MHVENIVKATIILNMYAFFRYFVTIFTNTKIDSDTSVALFSKSLSRTHVEKRLLSKSNKFYVWSLLKLHCKTFLIVFVLSLQECWKVLQVAICSNSDGTIPKSTFSSLSCNRMLDKKRNIVCHN